MEYDDHSPCELDHQFVLLERQLRLPGARRRCAETIRKINDLLHPPLPPPSPLARMTRPIPPVPSPGILDMLSRSPALPAWIRDSIEAKGFRPRALEKALHTGKLVFTSLELDEAQDRAKEQGWHQQRQPANLAEADDARFYGLRIEF